MKRLSESVDICPLWSDEFQKLWYDVEWNCQIDNISHEAYSI